MQRHTSVGIDIGKGVWIGANAAILDGVTIGAHSIVAAGAVVTSNFPDFSIIAGCPARLVKSRIDINKKTGDTNAPEASTAG